MLTSMQNERAHLMSDFLAAATEHGTVPAFSMKADERALFVAIANRADGTLVRGVVESFVASGQVHPKRSEYLLEKWAIKGFYEYGVSLDLGWLTPVGIALGKLLAFDAQKEIA